MQKLNVSVKKIIELARKHPDVLVIIGVIAYFAFRLIYFACYIHPGIPPDEITHYGISVAFSKALFIPVNGPDTYEFGVMTNRPYLYYWLMGKCLHLNFFSIDDLLFLRLINGLIGVICAIFVYKWTTLITTNKLTRFLTVILFTNIPMLTGLYASVSYDNLTNLFAVMSFYYLTMFYKRGNVGISAMFLISVFAGCLCKKTFLPLAVILIIAFAIKFFINLRHSKKHEQTKLSGTFGPGTAGLSLIALIFLVLNGLLYGGNLNSYGAIEPGNEEVIGVNNALKYRIFAIGHISYQYRKGNYTFDQAMGMTNMIKNKGDRAMAVLLLRSARVHDKNKLANFAQFTTSWLHIMLERALSYTGHQMLIKKGWDLYPYYWVLLISTFLFLRKSQWKDADGIYFVAFMAVLLYSSLILWFINYRMYLKTGVFGFSMAGRYLFPVLLPICGLISYYMTNFCSGKKQLIITVLVSAWFIYGDFIFFLREVPKHWSVW